MVLKVENPAFETNPIRLLVLIVEGQFSTYSKSGSVGGKLGGTAGFRLALTKDHPFLEARELVLHNLPNLLLEAIEAGVGSTCSSVLFRIQSREDTSCIIECLCDPRIASP